MTDCAKYTSRGRANRAFDINSGWAKFASTKALSGRLEAKLPGTLVGGL